jgi:hypothetical protein
VDETENLHLPYLIAAQAQKHVTHNEALRALDAVVQLAVLDRDLAAPPATPAAGARYIVAANASGAWVGKSHYIAAYQDDAWAFYQPLEGWLAWVGDEDKLLVWSGSAWSEVSSGGGVASVNPVPLVGVNTTADTSNRLAVKSNAVLFANDDVTPGTGSMQHKLSKASAAKTASLLLQDAYSGRAEIGLVGDDNLHVKVSADGATWIEALTVNRSNGAVLHAAAASFEATRTAGDVASVATIVCNNVASNVGGAYNATTGHFIAPVAGRYLVYAVGLATTSGSAELRILVNGSIRSSGRQNASAYGTTVQAFAMLNLTAGDDVSLVAQQGSFYGSGSATAFMGTYIG